MIETSHSTPHHLRAPQQSVVGFGVEVGVDAAVGVIVAPDGGAEDVVAFGGVVGDLGGDLVFVGAGF
jgi:hypothetical protein